MSSRFSIFLVFTIIIITVIGLILFWQNNNYRKIITNTYVASIPAAETTRSYNFEQVEPLPTEIHLSLEKVALGKRLFNETALSQNNLLSCASCHVLEKGGSDSLPVSIGINGAKGTLNAPTVFNSGFNFVQFWDGRAATLEEQAAGPVYNPVEMGSNWQEVVNKLQSDKSYLEEFNKVYGDGINSANIVDAIAVFERSLITPDSPFDRYLRGDKNSLTEDELRGYQLFKDYGCISCHQGINLGGNMFQRIGVIQGYFHNKKIKKSDLGRFNITGLEDDRHVFKVPGLRNVAVTAPYFHDGSIDTPEKAVLTMGLYQLGRRLTKEDIKLLTAFLSSLTGQWQGKPL